MKSLILLAVVLGCLVAVECRAAQTICANGRPFVYCFVEPCAVSKCANMDSKCTDNYCGGCHAVWTKPDGTRDATCTHGVIL